MPYGILEEAGWTRRIHLAPHEGYYLDIRVAKEQGCRDGMLPFYFTLLKEDPEDEGHAYYVTPPTGFENLEILAETVKEASLQKAPEDVLESLLQDVRKNIGVLFEPIGYFKDTEELENVRTFLTEEYAQIGKKHPEIIIGNWPAFNKILLHGAAERRRLPIWLPPEIDLYTTLTRPLEPEEFLDDMETRDMSIHVLKSVGLTSVDFIPD